MVPGGGGGERQHVAETLDAYTLTAKNMVCGRPIHCETVAPFCGVISVPWVYLLPGSRSDSHLGVVAVC